MRLLIDIINFMEKNPDLIREAKDEKDLQRIIALNVGATVGKIVCNENFPCMEIDVYRDGEGVEIKMKRKFYEGFGQAYAIRAIYKNIKMAVLHVNKNITQKELNGTDILARKLNIPTAVFDTSRGKIVYIYIPNDNFENIIRC